MMFLITFFLGEIMAGSQHHGIYWHDFNCFNQNQSNYCYLCCIRLKKKMCICRDSQC